MPIRTITETGITKTIMSNNVIRRSIIRYLATIVVLFVLVSILALSLKVTLYGVSMVGMDLAEQSNAESIREERSASTRACSEWFDNIGMRLFCRKLRSEHLYQMDSSVSNPEAIIASIKDVLRISPLEPAYWLALSDMSVIGSEDTKKIIEYSRMSYVTGRSQQILMQSRLSIMLGIWDELNETDKSIAVNDYIYISPDEREKMMTALNLLSLDQRTEFHQLVYRKDMKLADGIKLYFNIN